MSSPIVMGSLNQQSVKSVTAWMNGEKNPDDKCFAGESREKQKEKSLGVWESLLL